MVGARAGSSTYPKLTYTLRESSAAERFEREVIFSIGTHRDILVLRLCGPAARQCRHVRLTATKHATLKVSCRPCFGELDALLWMWFDEDKVSKPPYPKLSF